MYTLIASCRFWIAVVFLASATDGFSQRANPGSPVLEEGKEKWFDGVVGQESSGIVNGPEYFMPFGSVTTFPFYYDRNAALGDIEYDGKLYKEVPLSFDCFSGLVVFTLKKESGFDQLVQLDTARITAFRIYGHQFRKIRTHAPNGPAFYDVLFESPEVQLLARRTKVRALNTSNQRTEYASEDRIYFKGPRGWTQITGKRSVRSLAANRKEFDLFLKSNHISLREPSEHDLVRISKYFSENPTLLAGS